MKCSISECKDKGIYPIQINKTEMRKLCKLHLERFIKKDKAYAVEFRKANDL